MIQQLQRNKFFILALLLSLICFTLLWIYFNLGISIGSVFIYQGLLMLVPIADLSIEKKIKIQILITGLAIGPIYTIIYTFICLDYIFDIKFRAFNLIMGFLDNQALSKAAFIEYSIALPVNIIYLIILFILQKRYSMSSNHISLYISHLQNNNDNRINQSEQQMSIQNDENIAHQNNNNQNIRNNQNNIIYQNFQNEYQNNNNQNDNIFQIIQGIQGFQGLDLNQRRQLQHHLDSQRNLSSYEEEKEDFDSIQFNGQFFIQINADDDRQETVKTTVYSRDADSKDEGKECAICYEEFDKIKSINDKRLIQLTCAHTFHATCIRNSIQSIGWKCPYCRTKITQKISQCKQQGSNNIRIFSNIVFIELPEDLDNRQIFPLRSVR